MKAFYEYEKDGAAIYRRSFAIIRREAELSRFSTLEERVAVRVIHASGLVEAAGDLVFTPGAADAAERALRAGAPIFCELAHGRRGRDPRPTAGGERRDLHARRSFDAGAGGKARHDPHRGGGRPLAAAIGRRPYRHRQRADRALSPARTDRRGAPAPAAIIGMPVGFVGAAESKEALIESGLVAIVVRGRKGGSAMAAAAVNALASEAE